MTSLDKGLASDVSMGIFEKMRSVGSSELSFKVIYFVIFLQRKNNSPKVSSILSLFLLSQVFLIMTHSPLVRLLANILINGNKLLFNFKPEVPAITLTGVEVPNESESEETPGIQNSPAVSTSEMDKQSSEDLQDDRVSSSSSDCPLDKLKALEEKYIQPNSNISDLSRRPILSSIFDSLDSSENDYAALFTLCLLHALHNNTGKYC